MAACMVAAQAQSTAAWQFAITGGQSGSDASSVSAITTDASGNVYLAGIFTGTVNWGGIALTSVGDRDIFIAKWDRAQARFAWAKQAGGSGIDNVRAIAISNSSVYISGNFYSPTFAFGPSMLTNSGSTPSCDGYVAKLTDAGSSATFNWVQQISGNDVDSADALAVNGINVYLAGIVYSAPVRFGTLSLARTGSGQAFVAKLVDMGSSATFRWVQAVQNSFYSQVNDMVVSGNSLYITGEFQGTVGFGNTSFTSQGSYFDMFVAKLTDAGATGTFIWAQQGGSPGPDSAAAIAVTGSEVYITGLFGPPTANFGGNILATIGNTGDQYIAKLTDAGLTGSFIWARSINSQTIEHALDITVQGRNVYVVGSYNYTTTFGSTMLPAPGSYDAFICKLTDAGNTGSFDWVQKAGGTGNDEAQTVALYGNDVYVAGQVMSPASFGSLLANSSGSTGNVAFLAAITDTPLSINKPITKDRLSAFPNPVHGYAELFIPELLAGKQVTLTLTNSAGQVVLVRDIPQTPKFRRYRFDATGVPTGVYSLQLLTSTIVLTQKLLVD